MMLRHIFSLSLAMTACATFMPTKVNAATLTGLPAGEIPKIVGDSVEFTFEITPILNSVRITGWAAGTDSSELSPLNSFELLVPFNSWISGTTAILRGTYTVNTPVKDGRRDAFASVTYDERYFLGDFTIIGLSATANAGDVVPAPEPIPEPLTIFGTAMGLGGGILFKRKSFKKIVS